MKDKYCKFRRPKKKENKRERKRRQLMVRWEREREKKKQCRFFFLLARVSCGNGSTDVILCAFTSSPLFPLALCFFSFLFVFLVSLAIFSFSIKPLFIYVKRRKEEEGKKKGITRGRGKEKNEECSLAHLFCICHYILIDVYYPITKGRTAFLFFVVLQKTN